jgi:hypothetical protein
MRPTLGVMIALLLLLGTGVAKAADPAQLAETAGFLLGNAHRCGVPTARVEHASKVIHGVINAASYDPTEEAAANARFALTFLASAFPAEEGDDVLLPSCKVVIAQFERLERHHQQAGMD